MNHFRQTYAEIERLLDESETQDEFAKASDQLFDFEAILAKLVSTEPEKTAMLATLIITSLPPLTICADS